MSNSMIKRYLSFVFTILMIPLAAIAETSGIATSSTVSRPGIAATSLALFESTDAAMSAYQAGIQHIMNVVPDDISDRSHVLFPLSFIKRVVYSNTGWGHIQADNKMVTLTSGKIGGCWVMFFDSDHQKLMVPGPTLSTGKVSSIVAVLARPDRITDKWAGIFLMHEFSHAYDALSGTTHPPGFSEFIAYDLEKRTYNLLSGSSFIPVLDEVIDTQHIQSIDGLASIISTDPKRFIRIIDAIEEQLAEPMALSNAERTMRNGFFAISLATRIGERQHLGIEVITLQLDNFINQVSLYK